MTTSNKQVSLVGTNVDYDNNNQTIRIFDNEVSHNNCHEFACDNGYIIILIVHNDIIIYTCRTWVSTALKTLTVRYIILYIP